MKRLIYIIAVISTVLLPNAAFGITAPDLNAVIDHSVYNDPNTTVACTDNSNSTVSAAGGGLAANTTPSQKIAQTFIVGFDSATPNVKAIITDIVTKYRVGGIYIVNSQDHDAAAAGLNKAFFDTLTTASGGTPVTVASDEEGGQIHNYTYPSNFPSAAAMGTMSDTAVTGVGTMVGTQLATDGITEDLAPVLDINSGNLSTTGSTRNVIGSVGRSFSATPSVVATKASAFAKGVTGTGIDVTFKHFPGLGFGTGTNGNDSDHAKVTSPDISTLKTRDLIPYQTLITAYPNASIMMSNENVSGLDAAEPASVSPAVVSLLRNDYKFNGTITTDDLNTTSVLSQTGNLGAAVTKSLNAGVTRPLFGELGSTSATAEATLDSVLAAVTAGTQQATIDSAVTRVLAAKKPAISPVTGGAAATPAPAAAAAPGTVDSINGYKLPATTGQTGFEESVNVNGDVPSTGAPVSFPQYAKLGQAYRDYYVNMRWTFASWSWNGYSQMINQGEYDWMNTKPRLLVITNPKTGKSIIADAMETGPGPSVGSTWRAQHNNTSDVAPPYWQGFQTSTPAGYDGMVAGMPATAVAALGMTKATDIDPSYANGGVTTPLKFAWASDQNATPGPTTVTASGSNGSGSTASACCNTVTGQPSTGLSNVATSGTNSEKIFDFFRDNGATAAGAAGIVGNFTDESASNQSITPTGPDPTAQSSAGAGFHGIEKWSGDRWSGTSGLQAFAADKGGNWQDLTIQLNFSAFELGINTW
ncbi:hypothetical protein HJC99_03685 [Candidatus Saccharibacteria bacterium]|nr:hypothetical protein [Candidatus Saccharibacteria bacterium]